MSTTDEQIGRNLARLRGDVSQAELAARMRERGYKWSQATVWSIEKGDRPLRLTEAEDVGDALGVFSSYLTSNEAIAQVEGQLKRISTAHAALKEAISEFHEAQLQLTVAATEAADELDRTPLSEGVLDWLAMSAASTEREVRLMEHVTALAEEQAWDFHMSPARNVPAIAEVTGEADGDDHILSGVYADAFSAHHKETSKFRFATGNVDVAPSTDDEFLSEDFDVTHEDLTQKDVALVAKRGRKKSSEEAAD